MLCRLKLFLEIVKLGFIGFIEKVVRQFRVWYLMKPIIFKVWMSFVLVKIILLFRKKVILPPIVKFSKLNLLR